MKRSHWIIFLSICFILGLLVFLTVIHVINTTPSRARLVNAPAPVETVPVRRQDLIAAAWDELVPPASNVLDVVVAQLRRKLGQPQVVLTVRGVGYALR